MEVVVAGPVGQLEDAEPASVGGEARDVAVAAGREHALLLARLQRADVDVQVAPVAAVARVREQPPVRRQGGRDVEEVRLDDERLGHRPRARVEEIELRALVAALVDGEQDAVAAGDEPPVHRLRQVGQLHRLATRRNEVELVAAGDVPADERGAVVPDVGGQRPADLEQLSQRRHLGQPARDPLGHGDGAQVRVRPRDRRDDRCVRHDEPVEAENRAAPVDDAPDRARAGGMEDAPHLRVEVFAEWPSAWTQLVPGARGLGEPADEEHAVLEPRAVARLPQEAVIDHRRDAGIGRPQRHRAARVGLEEVDDGARPHPSAPWSSHGTTWMSQLSSGQARLRPRTSTDVAKTGPVAGTCAAATCHSTPTPGVVGQAAPDRKVGDDIDPELLELLVWPDPAAQEHGGRAVRAGREDHDVRREAPVGRTPRRPHARGRTSRGRPVSRRER